MGLFNKLFGSKKSSAGKERKRQNAELFQISQPAVTSQSAERKSFRLERREMLYAIVREAMSRVGILSSSYKYKVLSLDPRGREYMVMVDFLPELAGQIDRGSEIESIITQNAKLRHDMLVRAVYWRITEVAKESKVGANDLKTTFQSTFMEPYSVKGKSSKKQSEVDTAKLPLSHTQYGELK